MMALNNCCWFYGKFSIMRGWRSFFFLLPLCSMTTLTQEALPVLYSATQMWIYSNSLSSILCPKKKIKKSGMGMNSSNVDKRTRLIPCRCCWGLCEGTLCCPHSREKGLHTGESSVNNERKAGTQPSTAGSDCLVLGERRHPRST